MEEVIEWVGVAPVHHLSRIGEGLLPAVRARIVQLLVGRVDVAPAGEMEAAVIDQPWAAFPQPEIVVGTWRQAREEMDELTEADVGAALQQLDPLWEELFPAEQARIVQLLVARVDVAPDGIDIGLRMEGLEHLVHDLSARETRRAA